MITDIRRQNADVIRGMKRVASSLEPQTLVFQGYQVVPNSIVAKARFGGAKVNELILRLRDEMPGVELYGNDPTISPLGQNDKKAWGMAAHTTVGIFNTPFKYPEAARLQSALNGAGMNKAVPITHLSLDLQTWEEGLAADRSLVGKPFTHIARIAEVSFGMDSKAADRPGVEPIGF